tara:strand:+ start:3215 stop:3907 length:693 start_codon:yes stop_codon:yes gene_type:complete
MSKVFTTALRQRFSKLLLLAAESPFKGEQDAALAAAERLAKSCDLSLDEAAHVCREPEQEKRQVPRRQPTPREAKDDVWSQSFHAAFHRDAKADAAASRERQQDLWKAEAKTKKDAAEAYYRNRRQQKNGRRVAPEDFAGTLLRETDFPLSEIARITELPLQQLVAQKLKMRSEIRSYQESQVRKAEERRRRGLIRANHKQPSKQPSETQVKTQAVWGAMGPGRKVSSGS